MSANFTDGQMADLLDGIASGLPIGALAGIVGVSSPTVSTKLRNADFLARLVAPFAEYGAETKAMLERLERWWNYPGEYDAVYRIRHEVARVLRGKFKAEDESEQERARRRGSRLKRGGLEWCWNAAFERWEYAGGGRGASCNNWWDEYI